LRSDALASVLVAVSLACLCSLPFLVPTAPEPVPSFDAEWLAAALGLLAMVAAAIASPDRLRHWPRCACVFLAFAVLVVGQMAAGMTAHPRMAALACLYLLWAAGLAWLGAAIRGRNDGDRLVDVAAAVIALAASLDAVASLLQVYGIPGGLRSWILPMDDLRPGGNLGQPNHLALLMLWGLASLARLAVRPGLGRGPARLMALPALLLVIGLAVSGSRAGVLAAVALGVVVWRTGPRLAPDSPRRLRIGVGIAAFALAALMGVGEPRSHVDPAGTRFTEAAARTDQRPTLWRGAIAVFADAPVAGAGHGRFAGRFFEIAPDLPAPRPDVMTTHAHNAILQIAAEYGLAGLAVLLLGAIAWGAGVRHPPSRIGTWACWLVIPAAVQSLFEYPLWYAYFLGPFAFALGAAEGTRLEFGDRRVVSLVFAAASLVGAVLLSDLRRDFDVLRAFRGVGRQALLAQGDDALDHRLDALGRRSFLAVYVEVGRHRALSPDGSGLPAKLAFSREVLRTAPLSDVAWRHVALLEMADDPAAAALARRRAMASYPADAARVRPSKTGGEMP
jgi:O-antigen ligase